LGRGEKNTLLYNGEKRSLISREGPFSETGGKPAFARPSGCGAPFAAKREEPREGQKKKVRALKKMSNRDHKSRSHQRGARTGRNKQQREEKKTDRPNWELSRIGGEKKKKGSKEAR